MLDRLITHDRVNHRDPAIRDYFQLIGVNDPKRDRGVVTEVYENASVQLKLIDGVSIWLNSYSVTADNYSDRRCFTNQPP